MFSFLPIFVAITLAYHPCISTTTTTDSSDVETTTSAAQNHSSEEWTTLNKWCEERIAKNLKREILFHPTVNVTQPEIPLKVNAKLVLISLNEIDDANRAISLTARLDLQWYDWRLKLAEAEVDKCWGTTLLVKAYTIWFPYFIIQNGAK